MSTSEAMQYLQNLIGFKPSAKEMVHILGLNSPKTLYQRAHRDSEFTDLEIKTFTFLNPTYPEKVLTQSEAEELDLRIVAKVVKNLSLTI